MHSLSVWLGGKNFFAVLLFWPFENEASFQRATMFTYTHAHAPAHTHTPALTACIASNAVSISIQVDGGPSRSGTRWSRVYWFSRLIRGPSRDRHQYGHCSFSTDQGYRLRLLSRFSQKIKVASVLDSVLHSYCCEVVRVTGASRPDSHFWQMCQHTQDRRLDSQTPVKIHDSKWGPSPPPCWQL